MKYLVYDEASGTILRTGRCHADHVALQACVGESAIEDKWGDTDDRKHRIVAGERVEFTPAPAPPLPIEAQRARAYPPLLEYIDAKVKQSSTDPAVRDEGVAQEARYLADCLAVKESIPKLINKEK